jgi:membrane protein implicated in regulation of membrane protease activity
MDTEQDPGSPRPPAGLVVVIALLLGAPLVALMWVSSYARVEPRLFGFPFFYWYQFAWVFLCAITTSIAYRLLMGFERQRRDYAAGRRNDEESAP